MGRLALASRLALAAALAACSFQPNVPSGTVVCSSNADCPANQTCQTPTGETGSRRLCCGPLGCVSPGRGDAGAPPPVGPPAITYDASPIVAPDAGAGDTPTAPPPPPPDAGSPDQAPGPIDVAALVSCLRPIAPVLTPNGQRAYCSLALLDPFVVMEVDTIEGGNPTTTTTAQVCQAKLDLGAKTSGGKALAAADVDLLVALLNHYKMLCDQHQADEVVGAFAGGWARTAPNAAAIQAAVKDRAGLDLEIPTADQEVLQRYLATARNRRGWLVVHARGPGLLTAWWPNGAAAPTEQPVALDVAAADAMFFSSPGVTTYQEARRRYTDALDNELDGRKNTWRQQMQQNRLDKSLAVDVEAAVALGVNGDLRNARSMWDDADTVAKKVAAAPVTQQNPYGRSYGVLALRQLGQFVDSIDGMQFDQLRREPVKSAYGLRVMVLGAFLENLVRTPGLPIEEAGTVAVGATHGYLFRKRFTPD